MKRYARALLTLLAATVVLTWIAVLQMPDGRLHVFLLDVEGGQGILLRTPSGRCVLVDGGTQASALMADLGRHLPFWQRTLHAVVATHQGNGALLSLVDVSQRYRVIVALGPPPGNHPAAAYDRWRSILADRHIDFMEAQPGTSLDLGDHVQVEVVGKGPLLELRITYDQFSLLLPGSDASSLDGAAASAIAMPSVSRLSEAIPQSATTSALILLAGAKHPTPSPVPTLATVPTFSTAVSGTIELISDGRQFQVRTWR